MNRKKTLRKKSQISLIALTIIHLFVTGLGPISLLHAEGQTPLSELQLLLTQEEKELQVLKKEKQTKLDEQQYILEAQNQSLTKALQDTKELQNQIVKETYEELGKENARPQTLYIEEQLLQQELKHNKNSRLAIDPQVKKQMEAVNEARKQVEETKKKIENIVAHYDKEIAAVGQEKNQHQSQQQTLQHNQQTLLQVEEKVKQEDIQANQQLIELDIQNVETIRRALDCMVKDMEEGIKFISSALLTAPDDHVNLMISTIHVMANDENLKQLLAKLETSKDRLPAEWKSVWSTTILEPLKMKQFTLNKQIKTIVTRLAATKEKGATTLLRLYRQSQLDQQLAALENQLLAVIAQRDAKKVTATRQMLSSAQKREQEAYNQAGHSIRDRVEQERGSGNVLLMDLWGSWREEGAEHTAAQQQADSQTKDLLQVLKDPQWFSYSSLWKAINPYQEEQKMVQPAPTMGNDQGHPLYTTVEQAVHYASMAADVGQQLKVLMGAVQWEHKRKIENEPTFAKFFNQLGTSVTDSFQHPNGIVKSLYEGNKQALQTVENSLQTSLFGPEEAEMDAHVRQQGDKKHALRAMTLLAHLLEQIDTGVTTADLVAQAQLVNAVEQMAQTEAERATYLVNVEAAAVNVVKVKQAKEQVNVQRQAIQHMFVPIVEMIEHDLFDSPGWQAQILDKLKYVQFTLLGIDPIGSFVPVNPETITTLGLKGIGREVGILSRTTEKMQVLKEIEPKEAIVQQIKEEREEGERILSGKEEKACRPCGIGGRAKRSLGECCGIEEPKPSTSIANEESSELDKNIPAPPTEKEIAAMRGEIVIEQVDKNIPAPPTEKEIAAMRGEDKQEPLLGESSDVRERTKFKSDDTKAIERSLDENTDDVEPKSSGKDNPPQQHSEVATGNVSKKAGLHIVEANSNQPPQLGMMRHRPLSDAERATRRQEIVRRLVRELGNIGVETEDTLPQAPSLSEAEIKEKIFNNLVKTRKELLNDEDPRPSYGVLDPNDSGIPDNHPALHEVILPKDAEFMQSIMEDESICRSFYNFFKSLFISNDTLKPNITNVPDVWQLYSKWCWAASSSSILKFYNKNISTLDFFMHVKKDKFNIDDEDTIDVGIQSEEYLKGLNNYGVVTKQIDAFKENPKTGKFIALDSRDIAISLLKGEKIIAELHFKKGGGHTVVIDNFLLTNKRLHIIYMDPSFGRHVKMEYSKFISNDQFNPTKYTMTYISEPTNAIPASSTVRSKRSAAHSAPVLEANKSYEEIPFPRLWDATKRSAKRLQKLKKIKTIEPAQLVERAIRLQQDTEDFQIVFQQALQEISRRKNTV